MPAAMIRHRLHGRKITIKPTSARGSEAQRTATIKWTYGDIAGGIQLDREVDGNVSWNVSDCFEMKTQYWHKRWLDVERARKPRVTNVHTGRSTDTP